MSSSFDLEQATAAEKREAVRALLRWPLIVAEGGHGDKLVFIRRHRVALTHWFAEELGYRLVIESDFARLHKAPPARPPMYRPLLKRNEQAFDRRHYALFCLVLAALEQARGQTTLSALFDDVKLRATDISGQDYDFETLADRKAFTYAVQAIVDMGLLHLRDGDEDRFARGEEGGDALYKVHHRRIAEILSSPLPPSTVDDPAALGAEPYPSTAEGRARRSRHRIMRALIEEPVLHFDDLEEADRAYITSQRARLFRHLEESCGLDPELRKEGIVTIDEDGDLTDIEFPAEGTVAHAALLLGEELARRHRSGQDPEMTHAEVVAHMSVLAATYGKFWRGNLATGATGHTQLADLATERLAAFGLVRVSEAGVAANPAVARFALASHDVPTTNGEEQ